MSDGRTSSSAARVLVTGHRGTIGRAVRLALADAGFDPIGLDLADGDDLTDARVVRERIKGCRFIVHLAALDDEPEQSGPLDPPSTGTAGEIFRVNVGGTALLLTEAAQAGVERAVFLSSAEVLGCFMGQGRPAYLPIDDRHAVSPRSPYAASKLAGEELMAAFTATTGAPSVCLRAPGVLSAPVYEIVRAARAAEPESEWTPFWEYGAFIDVRDVASAVVAALTIPSLRGHHRLLINADDISSATEDGPVLAHRLFPDVPLLQLDRFARDRFSALVDTAAARDLLGWTPLHRWRPV